MQLAEQKMKKTLNKLKLKDASIFCEVGLRQGAAICVVAHGGKDTRRVDLFKCSYYDETFCLLGDL